MAISNNLLMEGVRGSINKQIVYRMNGTKQVVSVHPDMSRRILSPKQKKYNEYMVIANAEIRSIKANEALRNAALSRLNVPLNKLHHALLKEILLRLSKDSK